MRHESFRAAVLASVIAFRAQGLVVPNGVRAIGRALGHRAMSWLDARRQRLDDDFAGP